jgi:hypothetical protein
MMKYLSRSPQSLTIPDAKPAWAPPRLDCGLFRASSYLDALVNPTSPDSLPGLIITWVIMRRAGVI